MNAAILRGPGQLVVEDIPKPIPIGDEVLIRVKACGICGSDARYYQGDNPWSVQTLGVHKENPPNIVLGHELSGVIEECPPSHSRWQVGDRVAVLAYQGCGNCKFCASGRENLCESTKHLGHSAGWDERQFSPGGMAEYCIVWSDRVYALPESISFEEAVFLDGAAVALHAFQRGNMREGDHVLIHGCGPIGLMLLQIAKLRGAATVTCVDIQEKPLNLAHLLGADNVVLASSTTTTGDALRHHGTKEVDVIFDSVGTPSDVESILMLLARGGTMVFLVVKDQTLTFNHLLLAGERTLTVSANNCYPFFPEAIQIMEQGHLQVAPMITHRYPLSQAVTAFATMLHKEHHDAFKIVLLP